MTAPEQPTPARSTPDRTVPARTAPHLPFGKDGGLPTVLREQIEFHLREQLRPRLEGLTDEEYFFDPGGSGRAWTVHPRAADGETPPPRSRAAPGRWSSTSTSPSPIPRR